MDQLLSYCFMLFLILLSQKKEGSIYSLPSTLKKDHWVQLPILKLLVKCYLPRDLREDLSACSLRSS